MKIALIGSRTFPITKVGPQIAQYIKEFPEDTVFLTRASEGFDEFAMECAKLLGYTVLEYPGKGGAFNFERDVNIARDADKVIAFFDPNAIGKGGTQHVIDKALDQHKPVESFTVSGADIVFCGSDDGEDQLGGRFDEADWQAPAARQGSSQRHGQEGREGGSRPAQGNSVGGRPDRTALRSATDDPGF